MRLLDNVAAFMDELNLQNRYDHVILAGAAMGARQLKSPAAGRGPKLPWKAVFFDHLAAAINKLHREIKDIFLLEHLDCGAYKELHPDPNIRKEYAGASNVWEQESFHRTEARAFAGEIREFCEEQAKAGGAKGEAWKDIRVRCLLMDLLGDVRTL